MHHLRRLNWLRLGLAVWVVVGSMTAAGWRSEALGAAVPVTGGAACAPSTSLEGDALHEGTVSAPGPGPIALSNVVGWVEGSAGADDLGSWRGEGALLPERPVPSLAALKRKPPSPEGERGRTRLQKLCVYRL